MGLAERKFKREIYKTTHQKSAELQNASAWTRAT